MRNKAICKRSRQHWGWHHRVLAIFLLGLTASWALYADLAAPLPVSPVSASEVALVEAQVACDSSNVGNGTDNSCGHYTDTAGFVQRTGGKILAGTSSDQLQYDGTDNGVSEVLAGSFLPYFCCKAVTP
ncbi:MAG: hypothetical protein K8J08_16705 [Thermoanaerobaculia bacterium]|nr:hypothetical protein [Thermoanaerobaculia bacterium]